MTLTHERRSPFVAPALLVGLVIAAAATILWQAPGPGIPPADIAGALDWWSSAGTPAATIAVVRIVALGAAAWGLCLAVLAVVVSHTRSAFAARAWRRLAPVSLRRLIASSVIAAMVTAPAIVSAANHEQPPLPMLTDLGPADEAPGDVVSTPVTALPALVDLGDTPTTGEIPPVQPDLAGPAAVARWTVESGDHLWGVAQETLTERGHDPSTDDVARYWRRLIDDNRDLIGDDPDLIHPGMVLLLPD